MFQKLVSHNEALGRLVAKGYAVGFDGGYLIVRDIPYLDADGALKIGAFVTKLKHIDENTVEQEDHQVFFAGSVPHGLDQKPIPNLGGGETQLALSELSNDIVVERSFSNKPKATGRFADFFEKIESYVAIISGPAMERHGATPLTFRISEAVSESVFHYQDTLTSRAEITDLSAKFKQDIVALIGLGGTGAYVLDFMAKTPVKETRAFDADAFHVHNAYRSPGKLDPAELGKSKAQVYRGRYETFRKGVRIEEAFVDDSADHLLEGVTFAFVCVDTGPSRAGVFDLLIRLGIPFIDVGLGLKRKDGALNGMIRTTYYPPAHASKLRDQGLAELSESPNDLYRLHIQIGELNALNACMAVIRFKQLRGFYVEKVPNHHLLFEVGDLMQVGESELA